LKNKRDMFMNFQTSTTIALSLVLTPAVVINDSSTVQAQTRNCDRNCSSRFQGTRTGDARREIIEKILELIKSGQATLNDRLVLADTYRLEGKYSLAQEQLSQVSKLAKQNGDTEGEAIAHTRLGEIFTTTGKFEEASAHLTTAKNIYEALQNKQGINSVNRQLGRVRIQQRQLRQINPSRFKTHQR
jgi:predicted negative regulator of RcsB-dependent stress response